MDGKSRPDRDFLFVFSCSVFLLHPYLFLCLRCPAFCPSVFTYNTHPCPQRDSNPKSQQASDSRPSLQTARPLGSAGIRSPARPARSESLYRLSYPGPHCCESYQIPLRLSRALFHCGTREQCPVSRGTCTSLGKDVSGKASEVLLSLFHSIACLTTGPKRVRHRLRSSASCFNFQYPLVSFTASSSCLRLPSRLPVISVPPSTFLHVFQKTVPTQDVTNPMSLPPFYYMQDIPLLTDSM